MHSHLAASEVDLLGLVLRMVLLTSTALVAGIGLLRPAVAVRPRLAWAAAALAAAASASSAVVLDIDIGFAVAHALLALAVPVSLRWRTAATYLGFALALLLIAEAALEHASFEFFLDTVFAAVAVVWFGIAAGEWRSGSGLRPGPVALTAAIALAGAGTAQLLASGFLDRRLVESAHGLAMLVLTVAALAVLVLTVVLRDVRQRYRFGAAGVLVAVVAWTALPGLPPPADLPVPGVPRVVTAAGTSVLVSPHRPGRNLVHFPESAGLEVVVETAAGLARAVPRPGSSGTWAEIDLPAGRSELLVRRGAEEASVDLDTGDLPALPGGVGPDGAECASDALGGFAAGSPDVLDRCPSAELSEEDGEALGKLVGYLAEVPVPAINVVGDDSPRGRAATELVTAAAQQRGIPLREDREGALLVVSGWSRAAEALDDANRGTSYLYGVQLAPWLLHGPVVNKVPGVSIPLRFDPRDQRSLAYGMTLAARFGGEPPSLAGFRRWLAARGEHVTGAVSVYASAQVDVMQMPTHQHGSAAAGQWIPKGTIVAISGPLGTG
ncbi:hypothetical protein SAMN05421805_1011126 [Saccharopolyspora antimicrobica]|uniref:Uncharacterized protein n=1 Tax=Saccharopolyspora antimicrobica TaxID=455193 RepID=A0A1I4SSD9_9PSEU|nr:hypothetical protein [Saccharopolyspora antimicrobica]RKT86019.1 hypothetical protein ATL45_4377 [Saccharopolyspora antimicrobica]SFM67458.1 hypothetical protein SAMN05421805_1011126 [Saccharopolyspora antimicrobica]